MDMLEARAKRTQWFTEARFGMFIHWGLYAIPARGEWVRSVERISTAEYETFFNEFNPVDYNPKTWAKLAKEAGMQYAVLTAKHHDGFCLFDSKLTDYTAMHTQAKRDLVREYLDAFRAEGIRVGLYYSLLDWHHEGYPVDGDWHHPMRGDEAEKAKPRDFESYLTYMHGQVKELCTNYGTIDLLWFDFSYQEMTGEKWRAAELMEMVRALQPNVIIDNRLDASGSGFGSVTSMSPAVYSGDFASPEQIVPPQGIVNEAGDPVPWEACITMNNNWGYAAADSLFKPPAQLIRKLVECVSKNGNMLLNVGPDAKGNIPAASVRILQTIGAWMKANAESIYGCGAAKMPKPEWGYFTQKRSMLYAHIFNGSIGPLNLPGLGGKIKSARLLADGSEIRLANAWNASAFASDEFINFGPVGHFTYPLPDETDTVVALELAE